MRTLAGLSPGGSIALGIVVGVLSTSVQSLGLTLQRKSHILEDEKAPHVARRPPHRRRRWQLGMAMFLVANLLGSSVQISTLPLPVLSTLQASGLVFNSLCATLILGEPFTRWSLWGTLLVCSGAVLIAIFGAIPAPAHNLDELLALLARPPFVAWMALQGVVVLGIAVAIELVGTALAWAPLGIASTASSAATAAQTSSRFHLARGLAYGVISGILSAHSLLVAKSAVELVVRTIADGNNQFRHWQAWALVLVFVALALTQLYYLHRGLKLVSTSVLYPLVFCVYNIIAILDGLIYFHQTDLIGPLRGCLISLGTVILLSGVLALSWRLSDEQHPPPAGASSLGLDDGEAGPGEETLLLDRSDVAILDADEVDGDTDVAAEQQSLLAKKYASPYQTFTLNNGDTAITIAEAVSSSPPNEAQSSQPPLSPVLGRRHKAGSASFSSSLVAPASGASPGAPKARWTERAEIWGELEDQTGSTGAHPKRHRSKTLPAFLMRPALHMPHAPQSPLRAGWRGVSGGSFFGTHAADSSADNTEALAEHQRAARRRRKTMGFPSFQARRTSRQASHAHNNTGNESSPQEAVGGMWKLNWWGSNKGKQSQQSQQSQQPILCTSPQEFAPASSSAARPIPHDNDSPV